MIKGIIFDLGGVVLQVRIKGFLEKFEFLTKHSKEEMYDRLLESREWGLFDKGVIDQEELIERIGNKSGISKHILSFMAKRWRSSIKPDKDVIKILIALRKNYKLFALSNVDKETAKLTASKFGLDKHFDGMVFSCDVRMRKPERGIYLCALERMGLKPNEVIFIDNYPRNLPPAEALGIKTILYKSPEQLKTDLAKLGVYL